MQVCKAHLIANHVDKMVEILFGGMQNHGTRSITFIGCPRSDLHSNTSFYIAEMYGIALKFVCMPNGITVFRMERKAKLS